MGRFIASAAAAVALAALSACASGSGASSAAAMAGTWEGNGVQVPSNGTPSWPLRIVLNAGGDGAIAYPTLECGGPLRRLRAIGNTVVFREVITYGADNCIEGGTVTLVHDQGKLFWYWTGEGTDEPEVSAAAVLKKVGA